MLHLAFTSHREMIVLYHAHECHQCSILQSHHTGRTLYHCRVLFMLCLAYHTGRPLYHCTPDMSVIESILQSHYIRRLLYYCRASSMLCLAVGSHWATSIFHI